MRIRCEIMNKKIELQNLVATSQNILLTQFEGPIWSQIEFGRLGFYICLWLTCVYDASNTNAVISDTLVKTSRWRRKLSGSPTFVKDYFAMLVKFRVFRPRLLPVELKQNLDRTSIQSPVLFPLGHSITLRTKQWTQNSHQWSFLEQKVEWKPQGWVPQDLLACGWGVCSVPLEDRPTIFQYFLTWLANHEITTSCSKTIKSR